MLELAIEASEYFDDSSQEFKTVKATQLLLEHSLLSISKWESITHVPFPMFTTTPFTEDQKVLYVKCMTINTVPEEVYDTLSLEHHKTINEYMNNPMTATWFSEEKRGGSREVITSELIYYWMVALNIPFECQKWHIKRLLTLINVTNIKNTPPKKRSKSDISKSYAALNAKRLAESGTGG